MNVFLEKVHTFRKYALRGCIKTPQGKAAAHPGVFCIHSVPILISLSDSQELSGDISILFL